MVVVRVGQRELELLDKILGNENGICRIDGEYVHIERQHLEKTIQLIGDYFIKQGLDRKDEPTSVGLEIEALQDKFIEHLK